MCLLLLYPQKKRIIHIYQDCDCDDDGDDDGVDVDFGIGVEKNVDETD